MLINIRNRVINVFDSKNR